MRINKHPILGDDTRACDAVILVDGKKIPAKEGEPIAAALYISPPYVTGDVLSQPSPYFSITGKLYSNSQLS